MRPVLQGLLVLLVKVLLEYMEVLAQLVQLDLQVLLVLKVYRE